MASSHPPSPASATPWLAPLSRRVPAVLAPRTLQAVRGVVFVLAALPFLRLVLLSATDGLGANPVEFVLRSLGTWTLVLLLATLAISPLRRATGWPWLLRLRRMLGLYCFFYATLHLLAFAGLDQWFDLVAIGREIVKRPYITAGMVAFALLVPLALTSTNASIRRLGGRRWQQLHRLVYAVGVAAILHYVWHKAGKNDYAEPAIYGVVLAVLLGERLLHALKRWREARA